MPVDDDIVNPSDNRPFTEILNARITRRNALVGGLATAAVGFFAQSGVAGAAKGGQKGPNLPRPNQGPLLGFAPTPNPGGPLPSISSDYEYQVIIPWGTPLFPGVPDINGGRPASAADQERQVGIGHDGMWFFADNGSNDRGLLCINHEFGTNPHVLGKPFPESLEDVRISQAAHGVSVVELTKTNGVWTSSTSSRFNRRITANTPVVFGGPAAGSPYLESLMGNPPAGTVNNCANGYTPWGTYLTCEENFNGYFGAVDAFVPTEEQDRYGFSDSGFGYGWHVFDDRWDLNKNAGEENRFGWIVEIDPRNPGAPPVKHTAMGRFKHEGFAFTTGRGGRAVGYMGDDQRFDYIYKFVSASNWRSMRARGKSPFSEGTLYVARFDEDGTGEWLPLTIDDPALAERFADQAELLTYARIAADILGATPMDRPEWTSVAPNGDVYCTLTNNSRRTVADAANPEAPNNNGHIIRWRDADNHVGTTFEWDIFVLCTDILGTDYEFTDPDGLWCDPDGRVFVETDGGQPSDGNNQMVVADSYTGEFRRLFTGVEDDEITGVTVTPDRRTLFCNTQHPGDGDPTVTNFPVLNEMPDGVTIPRDATFVITRKDGGIVGS
jgi:secreted PhoX family phosphatase